MTKEELFKNIEILLEVLKEHKRTQVLDFKTSENLELFRKVVYAIVGYKVPLDTNCGGCVLHWLNTLLSYYERLYPEYLKTLIPLNEEPNNENVQVEEKSKSRRRSKKQG
ncbi:MAG: hypothetical protein QM737_22670 [Ferruginibacter sp.]